MSADILDFVSSGCRKQQVPVLLPGARVSSPEGFGPNLAGGVSSLSSPAALFGEPAIALGHRLKDQGPGNVVSVHSGGDAIERRRDLALFVTEISRGALVAKRATADLLSRCIHLRNSLSADDAQYGESSCKEIREPLLKTFAKNCRVGQ